MRIVYVDGFKIRNKYGADFGIIHKREISGFFSISTWFIPKNEIWIEKRLKDETEFLLKTAKLEDKLYKKLHDIRKARRMLIQKLCKKYKPKPQELTKNTYKKYGFFIREVDGGIVRKHLDPLFIIGGHFKVYPYVPKDEIWLDAKMNPKEMPYFLIHENIECKLMIKGVNYDIAHEYATAADKETRRRDGIKFPGDEDKKSSKIFAHKLLR